MNLTIEEAAKNLGISRCNLRLKLIEMKIKLKKVAYTNQNYTLYGKKHLGRRVIVSVVTPEQFESIKLYIESRRVSNTKTAQV
jgi:hypothetical protein